ncbi:Hypothetical protein A7982_11189 [Minicystis rosea]|nr:Hypothetical protein A7982_11189 [Minicystis rosea]
MNGKLGVIVEFNSTDGLGWIELDEGGRVRFGGNAVTAYVEGFGVGTRVEVRGTAPGYKGVPKAVTVIPFGEPVAKRQMKPDPRLETVPLPTASVRAHLRESGLDVSALNEGETITEAEVLELLFGTYSHGEVVGVGANEHAARDGVIIFNESHAVEGEEERTAQQEIAAVVARFGIAVPDEDLEDLGDYWNVAKAIDIALAAAGRAERAHLFSSSATGIGVVLIRERLVAGPLRFCSPIAS